MVFNPPVSRKIVSRNFPVFTVGNTALKFVSKYLGNIITDDLQDDADIEREIKSLFVRCNILISRFNIVLGKLKLNCFKLIANVCITQAYGTRSIRQRLRTLLCMQLLTYETMSENIDMTDATYCEVCSL